jgi:hypothetical protein
MAMKDFIAGVFAKPAYFILLVGLTVFILAAAGTITVKGQTIALADPVWRIVVGAVAGLLIVISVALIFRDLRSPRPVQPFKLQYDVFLASPMAALEEEGAYAAQRAEIAAIKDALRAHSSIGKIYDAGEKITGAKWDPKDTAAEVDLEALRHSRYFLLIYPTRLASSVLFEAGYALGMGKPSVYVARKAEALPYLMQELNNLSRIYPQVRIWECDDTAAIVERIRQTGSRMFTAEVPPPDC